MGFEIERKFIVSPDWLDSCNIVRKSKIKQCYLSYGDPEIRVRFQDNRAVITVKTGGHELSRQETERSVGIEEANTLCAEKGLDWIEKVRYCVEYGDHLWEVDIFMGENDGLILAEVELESVDEAVNLPGWVEQEVTGEKCYYNANLAQYPIGLW